jgi:hypothetical protein
MQNTMKKLHEAIHFLSQAEESDAKIDTKGIQNNLQVFISFERPVTNILHCEITKISRSYRDKGELIKDKKLSDWLQKKENELELDTLWCFFKERRNYILKRGSIRLTLNLDQTEQINISEMVVITRYDKDGQLINMTSSESPVVEENINREFRAKRKWTFEGWQGSEDVFTLSKLYLNKLVSALKEANEVFNNL